MSNQAEGDEQAETPRLPACFIDQGRICGPDCMAFLPQPPSEPDYQGEGWAHCHVLVNAHRLGKHLVILAGAVSKVAGIQRQAAAEAVRTQKAPGVTG